VNDGGGMERARKTQGVVTDAWASLI